MVFSSPTFLFMFLPVFLVLYFLLPWKNAILLISSLLFYAWGEPVYIVLMVAVIIGNYLFGLMVHQSQNVTRKLYLYACIVFNLLVLVYFKYFGFILDNINDFLATLNISPLTADVPPLPLGISFFIFQAITYVVDINRNHATVEKNPFNVALYISMFPQLVAGPIVRFEEVAKSIHKRTTNIGNIVQGGERFIFGLAKKVLIADPLGTVVDAIFSAPSGSLPAETAWLGIICFSLQIFFDFSAYSDMAIGLGKMLGFKFPENFNFPYIAESIQDFWRRWHMTLSRWFRDYVYIPLGGNRVSNSRTYFNLFAVFVLTGFWHGASWNFLIWGLFHGVFLVLERIGLDNLLRHLPRIIRHLYVLFVILISWVFFRVEDFESALDYLASMFFMGGDSSPLQDIAYYSNAYIWMTLVIGLLISIKPLIVKFITSWSGMSWGDFASRGKYQMLIALLIRNFIVLSLLIACFAAVSSQTHKAFIYFRF